MGSLRFSSPLARLRIPAVLAILLWTALPTRARSLAEIAVFQDSGDWQLNPNRHLWSGPIILAPDASLGFIPGNAALFDGPVTVCQDDSILSFNGIAESQFDVVFAGGLFHSYDTLEWPPVSQVEAIRNLVPAAQVFAARDEQLRAVTTEIRFREQDWLLSRWVGEESSPGDTLYLVDHEVQAYPGEVPLIWIQGVARIEGVVGQSLTVLVSDSLFLTGDLIVPGTDVTHYDDPALFGMAPVPSDVLVGLIGEGPVILAATLENGLGGFTVEDPPVCDLDFSPVVNSAFQARRDVIVTASILAMGCMLEAEYWVTTATGATAQAGPIHTDCGTVESPPLTILDCAGADPMEDERGNFWFCGSLARSEFGYLMNPWVGPWNASIGYTREFLRHDPNLVDHSPPYWPEQVWVDPDPLIIEVLPSAAGLCGVVQEPEAFGQLWTTGGIGLHLSAYPHRSYGEDVRVRTWAGPVLLEDRAVHAFRDPGTVFLPDPELLPTGPCRVYFEVLWEDKSWNTEGELCSWFIGGQETNPPTIQLSPAAESACAQPLSPMDWAALLLGQEIFVDFTAYPDPEAPPLVVHADTWMDGSRASRLSGQVLPGETVRLYPTPPVEPAPGEHEYHLTISWNFQQWNPGGMECTWRVGTTAVSGREHPDDLAVRVYPNPANPVFRVEAFLAAPAEVRLILYDIAGRRVLDQDLGYQPAGLLNRQLDPGTAASGVYLVVLEAEGRRQVGKVLLLR